ncbi:c-type cytochrome [Roseomonas sp. CCTCC AB2023176]|uniref:c-type cytochrome n=1 Tax=Roseomonas sp. CCTCC AB2023176 TaxID=3342640 RepID=UPI0035DF9CCA
MRSITRIALIAATALAVGGVAVAQTAPGANPVQTRQDGLKRMQDHMQAIQAAVRAGGDMRPLSPRVDDMVTWFQGFPQHFPAGSDQPPSKALPTVWSDRAGFEQRASDAVAAAQRLKVAVDSGDAANVGPALQAMGGACGACHRVHRGR